MKNKLFSLVILFLLSINLSAQDSSKTSLKKSSFAIQFRVHGFLEFSSFQGGALSIKYHILDKSSVRIGFGINTKFETERKYNNNDNDVLNKYNFNFNAQFIQNTTPRYDVSLYFGGGPYYERKYYELSNSKTLYNEWSLGLSAVLGIEWFFKKNMSLHGEYGILFLYNVDSDQDVYNDNILSTKSIIVSDSGMMKVGISLYL